LAGRLATWFAGRSAAGIVACSASVARQFHAPGVPRETILPPADEQDYASGDRVAVRSRFGVGADAECVVAVGSISEGRGQDVLLEAMVAVRRERPGVRCLIFGGPHPRPQDVSFARRLEDMVRELGLQDAVVLPGRVDDLAGPYAAADVVVNPARIH
jgi:glycosyltransferase involved in cell wall biosynthesis